MAEELNRLRRSPVARAPLGVIRWSFTGLAYSTPGSARASLGPVFQGKGTSSGGKPPPPQRRTHAPRLFRCKAIPLIEMFVKPAWCTGPGRGKAAPSGSIGPILPVVVPVVYRSSRRRSGRFALKPGSDAAQRRRIGAPGLSGAHESVCGAQIAAANTRGMRQTPSYHCNLPRFRG